MVKSIQGQMFQLEPRLTRGVYFHIYKQLQDFVHSTLPEPLRKAEKHHKEILKGYVCIVTQCNYFVLDNMGYAFSESNYCTDV